MNRDWSDAGGRVEAERIPRLEVEGYVLFRDVFLL